MKITPSQNAKAVSSFARWTASFRKLAEKGAVRISEIQLETTHRMDVYFNNDWLGYLLLDNKQSPTPRLFGMFGAEHKDFSPPQAIRYVEEKIA